MRQLCHKVLASSQKTVLAGTRRESDKEINTQLGRENICKPQGFSETSEGPSNHPHLMDRSLDSPQETYQLPNSKLALKLIKSFETYCSLDNCPLDHQVGR